MLACPASADGKFTGAYNTFGYSGLIDMPSAFTRPDGELALTYAYSQNTRRTALTFQLFPRLTASLRYSKPYNDVSNSLAGSSRPFDRSLSLQYLITPETARFPAIAVGLNDFIGTGINRSEYVVASKTLSPRLRGTVGLGWGRLAGFGGFSNPLSLFGDGFKDRDNRSGNPGGQFEVSQIFHGDAAFFGGLEYQATDRLKFTLEYSSYRLDEKTRKTFEYNSPFNFGISYQFRNNLNLKANYLYGSEIGLQFTYALNPKLPPQHSGRGTAPPAVVPRERLSAAALGWQAGAGGQPRLEDRAGKALERTGLGLHGLTVRGSTARIEIENDTYSTAAQAIGRTARAMTGVLPPQVETFVIVPVRNGIAVAETRLRRQDIETLEYDLDGAWKSYSRAEIQSATGPLHPSPLRYPRFEYDLAPYVATSLFDPDDPFRADLGLSLSARYEPAPGWVIEGAVRKKLVGNLDSSTRKSDSVLPKVRSDFNIYDAEGDPALSYLTANYYFKPGHDLYGRVSFGYFETQYGGLSAELLWKRFDSPLAFGVELNYVKQRAFDQGFGFRDYQTATGHASVYYDFGGGYHGQLDVGRYLAGDWGATISLDRTFRNGWSIGAFATFTDVSADDFGEGSFDKGIRITVPVDWVTGRPSRKKFSTTIRPITRDGGARVNMRGRLNELLSDMHDPAVRDGWGRFWR